MSKANFDLTPKVKKYYRLTIYLRWLVVIALWLTVGVYGIWGLRQEIQLWLDYFTWSGIRYGLAFNLVPTLCVGLCAGMTLSVLVWQSGHIIWGFSDREKYELEQKVNKILAQGSAHPLWKWLKG